MHILTEIIREDMKPALGVTESGAILLLWQRLRAI